MRRLAAACLLAGLWLVATGPAAGAHGNLRASEPANGSALAQPPRAVLLEFSEAPDQALSAVHVLDAGGRPVERGRVQPVPGRPGALQVPVGELPSGVYTVSWRVVSRVDGHTTRGVFAFGVGDQAPARIVAMAPQAERQAGDPPTVLGVAGRWAVYWGFALLLGAATTGLVVFGSAGLPGRPAPLLVTALLLAAAGLVTMAAAAKAAAGVSPAQLAGSATGLWLAGRGTALLVAAAAVAPLLVLARPSPARHLTPPGPIAATRPLAVLALATAGGLLLHALAGHAAAPSPVRGLNLLAQWAHLVAVGVWIGGLAWLLHGLRGLDRVEQVAASLRFSRLAAAGLAVVVVTGLGRSVAELGGWQRLADTGYGRALFVKVVLFAALAGLGAGNRFLVIPALRAGQIGVSRLRGTVGGELALAAVVLAAAALLSELPPGAGTGAGARPAPVPRPAPPGAVAAPAPVQASGSDYTTSMRVTLTVTPGVAGPNRFTAHVADYDTGAPLRVERLRLKGSLPSRPDLEASSLDLAPEGDGHWHGQGSLLSISGRWDLSAQVETGSGALTVPLQVDVGLPAPAGQAARARPVSAR